VFPSTEHVDAVVSELGPECVAVLRAREAVALNAFYGQPAQSLSDAEVVGWGLLAGVVPLDGTEPGYGPGVYRNRSFKDPRRE